MLSLHPSPARGGFESDLPSEYAREHKLRANAYRLSVLGMGVVEMIDKEVQKAFEDMQFNLSRHLVVCGCIHRKKSESHDVKNPWKQAVFSGIVMSFHGTWYCATAGHCIRDFQEMYDREDLEIEHMFLADHFGRDATSFTGHPFNLKERDDSMITMIDDEKMGLDFGMIQLQSLERQGMEKNGIVPVTEDRWMPQDNVVFDRHFLLGAPAEEASVVDGIGTFLANPKTALFNVHPVDEQMTIVPEIPWLAFRIPDSVPLESIAGMSGGPIFGARLEGDAYRYWITALQSRWNEKKRIAFACPLPEFSRVFQATLSRSGRLR